MDIKPGGTWKIWIMIPMKTNISPSKSESKRQVPDFLSIAHLKAQYFCIQSDLCVG